MSKSKTMYLNFLTQREKELFLKLSYEVSKADGKVLEEEISLIHQFAEEMQISPEEMADEDTATILSDIAQNSTNKAKRIIFIELLAIALVDNNFANPEIGMMSDVAKAFNISPEQVSQALNAVTQYIRASNMIIELIEEEG